VLSHGYAEPVTDVNAGWITADHTVEFGDPAGHSRLTNGSCPVTAVWSDKDSD
jgi:hypothetical protein